MLMIGSFSSFYLIKNYFYYNSNIINTSLFNISLDHYFTKFFLLGIFNYN